MSGRDFETARLARAYVVARVKRPRDLHRHSQLFRELRARVYEDLRIANPAAEESPAEAPMARLPYRDD